LKSPPDFALLFSGVAVGPLTDSGTPAVAADAAVGFAAGVELCGAGLALAAELGLDEAAETEEDGDDSVELKPPSFRFTASGLVCIHGHDSVLVEVGKPVVLLDPLAAFCAITICAGMNCSNIRDAQMRDHP
jgi:hypothetical protein